MEVLLRMTVVCTLALAFALVIERAIEVIKSLYDLIDSRCDLCNFWTARTRKIQSVVNKRLKNMEFLDPATIAGAIYKLDVLLVSNQDNSNHTVPVLSGDLVRSAFVKIVSKFLGIILGIIVTFLFHLNFLTLFGQNYDIKIPEGLQTLVSGVIIGLGSAPVHKVILSLEKGREKKMSAQGGAQ